MIQSKIFIRLVCKTCIPNRNVSCTAAVLLNQKFRKEKGLPLNPNASGILTDSPDYSFLDGRLTPLGPGQRERVLHQAEVKKQIISLSQEIDFAVARHNQILIAEENRKQQLIGRKLKPKGTALLEST